MALLRLDGKRRDRPRVQPLERNRLTGFFAKAVGAVLDPAQGGVDLGDQFPLPVTGSQFQLALRLGRGTVGQISMWHGLGLKILDGLAAFPQDFFLPAI